MSYDTDNKACEDELEQSSSTLLNSLRALNFNTYRYDALLEDVDDLLLRLELPLEMVVVLLSLGEL